MIDVYSQTFGILIVLQPMHKLIVFIIMTYIWLTLYKTKRTHLRHFGSAFIFVSTLIVSNKQNAIKCWSLLNHRPKFFVLQSRYSVWHVLCAIQRTRIRQWFTSALNQNDISLKLSLGTCSDCIKLRPSALSISSPIYSLNFLVNFLKLSISGSTSALRLRTVLKLFSVLVIMYSLLYIRIYLCINSYEDSTLKMYPACYIGIIKPCTCFEMKFN